jgi:hypothetical protein
LAIESSRLAGIRSDTTTVSWFLERTGNCDLRRVSSSRKVVAAWTLKRLSLVSSCTPQISSTARLPMAVLVNTKHFAWRPSIFQILPTSPPFPRRDWTPVRSSNRRPDIGFPGSSRESTPHGRPEFADYPKKSARHDELRQPSLTLSQPTNTKPTDTREPTLNTEPHPLGEHYKWIRTVVRSRLRDPNVVDDVLQDVTIAYLKGVSRLRDPSKLAPWLYRIAVRQVLQHRRAVYFALATDRYIS